MNSPRILIACIGNIFLGDDAFGVEVARELLARKFPQGVRVIDFGIRGLDLAYALMDGWDAVILVDACPRDLAPGSLFVLEPDAPEAASENPNEFLIETHGMHPAKVLRLVAAMGGKLDRVLLVGCQPAPFDPESDLDMNLSAPVRCAVKDAVPLIQNLIDDLLKGDVRHARTASAV